MTVLKVMLKAVTKINEIISLYNTGGIMKGFVFFILLILTFLTYVQADVQLVTVDGDAFLTDSTDHSGIKVKFQAISPSAQTDSCYTNADGYYNSGLAEVTYSVNYTK